MVTPRTGRPIGRPPDPNAAERIVAHAWRLFLERGVEGVSVDRIAASAGVSKATVYKYFADKPALFEAGVRAEMERIEAAQDQAGGFGGAGDLRSTLIGFGIGVMAFIVSNPAVDFYTALAGELSRHEDLARRFYDMGPGRTRANLAGVLAAAAARGELAIEDAHEAAEHLFGLWQGFSNFQLALGIERESVRADIPGRIARAVDRFLCAYAAETPFNRKPSRV